MLNPDIQFDRLNLSVMALGGHGDDVSQGWLDSLADCPTRRRPDDGLTAILGLPDMAGFHSLASELVVTNRRL